MGQAHTKTLEGFFAAVKARNISEIKAYIETNPWIVNSNDFSDDNCKGWTAMHYAAANNLTDVAKVLLDTQQKLDRKAKPNATNLKRETPLHIAASLGNMNMVIWLLKNGAHACINALTQARHTALDLASNPDIYEELSKHGAQPSMPDENKKTSTATAKAATTQTKGNTKQQSEKSTSEDKIAPDKITSTPPSPISGYPRSSFKEEKSTIFSLIEQGKESEVLTLLKNEPHQVYTTDDSKGQTLLHYAIRYSQLRLIKKLIEVANQDINIPDKDEKTPFHLAIIQKDIELVQLLIANGADLKMPIKIDGKEISILKFAGLSQDNEEMIMLLTNASKEAEAQKPNYSSKPRI